MYLILPVRSIGTYLILSVRTYVISCLYVTLFPGWEPVNVREFERHAQLMLSKNAFDYYASGANDMVTLRENRRGFLT